MWDVISYPSPDSWYLGMDKWLHPVFYMNVITYPCPIKDVDLPKLC